MNIRIRTSVQYSKEAHNFHTIFAHGVVLTLAAAIFLTTACSVKPAPKVSEPPVAIIAVDEKTIKAFGHYPLRRSLYADCVDVLSRHGAAVVAINLIFDLPSSHGKEEDERLARAVSHAGNVILMVNSDGKKIIYPTGALKKSAHAFAHCTMWTGKNMRIKGIAPLARASDNGKFIPALAFAVAREYIGVKEPMTIEGNSLAAVLLYGMPWHLVKLGDMSVPLYDGGLAKISYKGPAGSIKTFSMADVVGGKIGAQDLRGRICFVGIASDEHETSAGVMSATEIHANAAITVINHLRGQPATGFRANSAVTVINALRAKLFTRRR